MELKKFFNDWNHQYQLEIIAVYHNVQNEKKHMSKSRDIEFGDKNNLETGPKWAQFGPEKFFWRLKPPVPARKRCGLS